MFSAIRVTLFVRVPSAKAPVAVVATMRQTARSAANKRFQSMRFMIPISFKEKYLQNGHKNHTAGGPYL